MRISTIGITALIAGALVCLSGGTLGVEPPVEPYIAVQSHVEPVVAASEAVYDFPVPVIDVAMLPTYATYYLSVDVAGGQVVIDRCVGPVWADYPGYGTTIAQHNYCGGAVILDMKVGDHVVVTGYGAGEYVVTGSKIVTKPASADVLGGGLWLQTCYFGNDDMRLVRIALV